MKIAIQMTTIKTPTWSPKANLGAIMFLYDCHFGVCNFATLTRESWARIIPHAHNHICQNGPFSKNIHTPPTEEMANRYSHHVFGHPRTTEVNLKFFLPSPFSDGTNFLCEGGMDLLWNDPMKNCQWWIFQLASADLFSDCVVYQKTICLFLQMFTVNYYFFMTK